MIPQFSNKALTSLYLWAENRYLNSCQAYQNYTSRLYYQPDSSLGTGYVAYAAPFKQWVYDSGINGANILQSISGGAVGELTRASGLHVDYNGGRIILPASFGTSATITGSYAFKEVNIYLTNEDQASLVSQNESFLNPRFKSLPTGATSAGTIQTPAIFVSMLNNKNEPWEIGGIDMCHYNVTMTVMTQTPYQMDGILGVMADGRHQHVPILSVEDDPINEWGDLKSGYNYNTFSSEKGTPGNLIYINEIKTSKISDKVKLNQSLYMGFVDVDMSFPRQTL